MKNRTIDLALIAGLVLVAGAIVWTLFSLGGTGPGAPPDPGRVASDGAGDPARGGEDGADGGGVVPVDPDGEADADGGDAERQASPGGVAPLAPGEATAEGEATADGDDAPGGAAAGSPDDADGAAEDAEDAEDAAAGGDGPPSEGPDPQLPAAQAPPVPESGPVELGRIGFSYVTGGAGACGIVLEPWTHVAVSRELLEAYGCGAEVTVTLDDPADGRSRVQATVADTMNPSFSRTVNVYVGEDEPALAYGLTSGTIEPR